MLVLLTLGVLYPLVYILSSSFSNPSAVAAGRVVLFPVNFSLEGYKAVFKYPDVYVGYRNTILYTVFGTILNVTITILAAYPLSRKDLLGRNKIMFIFAFTMIVSGGMIPTYILIKNLGLLNRPLALIIPGALSVYNLIIARTFFQTSLPGELLESAQMDGCSDFQFFWSIALPLSKAILAVLCLFYAVAHWNAYFSAFLYLNNEKYYPLQLFLREILLMNSVKPEFILDPELAVVQDGMAELLKYSLIVVSSLPVLVLYPFAQKYFVKGVMLGSLKG
jgi:multiple sugar transport system permease protein/putative aldouronate transport system permease protein